MITGYNHVLEEASLRVHFTFNELLQNPVVQSATCHKNLAVRGGRIWPYEGLFKYENDWPAFCIGQNKVYVITRWQCSLTKSKVKKTKQNLV